MRIGSLLAGANARLRDLSAIWSARHHAVRFANLPSETRTSLLHLASDPHSELRQRGWFMSRASMQSIEHSGRPTPWYTYAMTDFLSGRVKPDMRVVEFGAGYSTLWWAGRVDYVKTFESNEKWFGEVKQHLPGNAELILTDIESAPAGVMSCIGVGEKFDIVVVDGGERNELLSISPSLCTERGVIVLDNSDREEYAPGVREIQRFDFKSIEFRGMGPINLYAWSTTIFYRPNNCLDI